MATSITIGNYGIKIKTAQHITEADITQMKIISSGGYLSQTKQWNYTISYEIFYNLYALTSRIYFILKIPVFKKIYRESSKIVSAFISLQT